MKRLRKLMSIALAWTSVCLLSIDPASACRLLNRRCCTCCCAIEPVCCADSGDKSAPPAAEPSPSDQPRPMANEVAPPAALPITSTPTSPSVHLQPSADVVRGSAAKHSQPAASSAAPAPHETNVPANANTPTIERAHANTDQPTTPTAPPVQTEYPQRQPSEVPPTAITNASDAEHTPNQSLTNAAPVNIGPQKTMVTPKQTFSPGGPTAHTDPATNQTAELTAGEPALTPKRSLPENGADAAVVESSPSVSTRQPAAPGSVPPAGTVTKPEFPTVGDDPFSPLVSPSPVPAAAETHSDDPFAPLPAAPTTSEKPDVPLVVEPTKTKIDMLAAGNDGRLPLREWTDNSGKFTVKAKLVLVLDGKVRLLKETGRTTTVALERLSKDDRAYVAAAIERYGEDLAKLHQFASR